MEKKYVVEWDVKVKMVCMVEDEDELNGILDDDFRDKIENWTPNYARIMRDYYDKPIVSYDECEWNNFNIRLATDEDED